MHWFAVAIGGALGSLARYALSTYIFDVSSHKFPYATLAINVLGSFAMGILFVLIVEKAAMPSEMRSLLMIGFLGAFTTFSVDHSLHSLAAAIDHGKQLRCHGTPQYCPREVQARSQRSIR